MSKRPLIERPQLTVDVTILAIIDNALKVLLVRRDEDPYKGQLALPGGFLWHDERLEETAARILKDKTGLTNVFIEQLYTFDALNRDPRGRVLSAVYYALVDGSQIKDSIDDHTDAQFMPLGVVATDLAFDHQEILNYALSRVRSKVGYTNAIHSLLPREFTFNQLQTAYETILGYAIDKRNFRKKYLSLELIEPTGNSLSGKRHRPAAYYRFKDLSTRELPSPVF